MHTKPCICFFYIKNRAEQEQPAEREGLEAHPRQAEQRMSSSRHHGSGEEWDRPELFRLCVLIQAFIDNIILYI